MKVAINTSDLERRFRSQSWRFFGVAAMMIVSLAIGMGLLVRSVQNSLEQARRTENMVAAVTHELRTPLAAVKMYSEMLKDGWIVDRSKQEEYLERILRETNRLDSLIDRVLQKRKLGIENADPEPGDLSAVVAEQIPDLKLTAGTVGEDLDFDLATDLPDVMLVPEGVHAILVNLVENARKYAPALRGEKILVRTRKHGGKVVLEVADRGPGIPDAEKTRVFDAFYRIGDEKRRSARGTGLGLHIVWLQCRAMRARVQALSREGGGALFRVTFKHP